MSTTTAADLNIPATVAALDAAPTRDAARQIIADWRTANWDAWVTTEAHARHKDARAAKAAGDLHLLEHNGSWRVDYLPAAIHRAEVRALARVPSEGGGTILRRHPCPLLAGRRDCATVESIK